MVFRDGAREHPGQDAVAVDATMPERGADVHCDRERQREVQRLVREQQDSRKLAVLRDEIRQGHDAQVHDRHAGRRTVEPARQRNGEHQRVQRAVRPPGGADLPRRHRRGPRRGRIRHAQREPRRRNEEHGDAEPLVPAVVLELRRGQGQAGHEQAERESGEHEQRAEPVQRDRARRMAIDAVAGGVRHRSPHAPSGLGRWAVDLTPGVHGNALGPRRDLPLCVRATPRARNRRWTARPATAHARANGAADRASAAIIDRTFTLPAYAHELEP